MLICIFHCLKHTWGDFFFSSFPASAFAYFTHFLPVLPLDPLIFAFFFGQLFYIAVVFVFSLLLLLFSFFLLPPRPLTVVGLLCYHYRLLGRNFSKSKQQKNKNKEKNFSNNHSKLIKDF